MYNIELTAFSKMTLQAYAWMTFANLGVPFSKVVAALGIKTKAKKMFCTWVSYYSLNILTMEH